LDFSEAVDLLLQSRRTTAVIGLEVADGYQRPADWQDAKQWSM
jgi:hypothetical protein